MDLLQLKLMGIPLIIYLLGILSLIVFILLMYKKQRADDFLKNVLPEKLKELSTDNIISKIVLQINGENIHTIGNNMSSLTLFGKMQIIEKTMENEIENETQRTELAQFTIIEIESFFILSLTALYYFFMRHRLRRKIYLFITYKVNEIPQVSKNNDYIIIFNDLESMNIDNTLFLFDNKEAFLSWRNALLLDKSHLKEQETSIIGKIYADTLITTSDQIDLRQNQ